MTRARTCVFLSVFAGFEHASAPATMRARGVPAGRPGPRGQPGRCLSPPPGGATGRSKLHRGLAPRPCSAASLLPCGPSSQLRMASRRSARIQEHERRIHKLTNAGKETGPGRALKTTLVLVDAVTTRVDPSNVDFPLSDSDGGSSNLRLYFAGRTYWLLWQLQPHPEARRHPRCHLNHRRAATRIPSQNIF